VSEDFSIVGIDGRKLRGQHGWLDITGIDSVEVLIRHDGKVLWINGPDLRLRICSIRGPVTIKDERGAKKGFGNPREENR
jgi:hypothetical protein